MNNINLIFIEEKLVDHPRTKKILENFPSIPQKIINRYDEVFGVVKKPYLQKRQSLSLFIAEKKGHLVKEAPEAYGTEGERHYYFIHAYNCIYECEYCYLQGYFHSPDLVLFINHEDLINDINAIALQNKDETLWFHAGEFSDSLALSHLTKELPLYFAYFKKNPHLKMELRTKSDNIQHLLEQTPLPNVITSFSLSPSKNLDYKAPSLEKRLQSIELLHKSGFPIGIHLDPIIPLTDYKDYYEQLVLALKDAIPLDKVNYFSLGITRFPEKIYHQVKKNYPNSIIFNEQLFKDKKGIMRSPKPIRFPMMENIKNLLIENGAEDKKIYLCME